MGSSQDIDALLISALYGELTPAEETRLAAHLETHPADRTALSDLTRARELVRASRLFDVQLEPPPAMSALLLQEAARRAPRTADGEQAGWLARFLRSFMAHPAMAAAAMLVVVVGVATMVTKRSGDHFAESSAPLADEPAATRALEPASSAGEMAPAPGSPAISSALDSDPGSVAIGGAPAADSETYRVGLADGDGYVDHKPKAEEKAGRGGAPASKSDEAERERAPARQAAPKGGSTGLGIELRKPEPAPKDFAMSPADNEAVASGAAAPAEGSRRYAPAPTQPAAPPPPPKLATPRDDAPATKKTVTRTTAPDADKAADPLIAWAREQHGVLIAQVHAGRCTDASRLAVTIADRAPSYYEQNVATDRAVKACSQYIIAERQKVQQERAKRAKASDAKRAEEPAKRAADQPAATGAK